MQSQVFDINHTLSIEGNTCKDGFSLTFSDDSSQKGASTFVHIKKFIHWMHDNIFFINDGILYDTTYLCRKQYIYENKMWLLFVLEFLYRVTIDRCNDSTGNGGSKPYGINGSDKSYLRQKCAW